MLSFFFLYSLHHIPSSVQTWFNRIHVTCTTSIYYLSIISFYVYMADDVAAAAGAASFLCAAFSTISSKWRWLCKRTEDSEIPLKCAMMCARICLPVSEFACIEVCEWASVYTCVWARVCVWVLVCVRCKSLHRFTNDARIKWWGSPS